MPYTHLTPTERGQLHALCKEGKFQTYMAACLGRHRSTISRELRRNRASHGYDAPRAQRQCDQRREWCRPAQKQTRRMLWRYVIDKLMEGGPPEAIAVRLPLEFPDDATMRISHEAIYRTLYLDKRWHHLIKYLPRARSKRRKRGQGKTSRGPGIPNRVGIEQRPPSSKNAPVWQPGRQYHRRRGTARLSRYPRRSHLASARVPQRGHETCGLGRPNRHPRARRDAHFLGKDHHLRQRKRIRRPRNNGRSTPGIHLFRCSLLLLPAGHQRE